MRSQLSEKSTLICEDSILGLRELTASLERIDLLYLDSMDLCWIAPETSAVHHLKELAVSLALLRSGSLVLIDDSPRSEEWLPPWAANWSQPIWEIIPPEARLKWLSETVAGEALSRISSQQTTPDIVALREVLDRSTAALSSGDLSTSAELTEQLKETFLRCIPGTTTHPDYKPNARCPGKGLYACELLETLGEKIAHDYQVLYRIT